MQVVGIDPGANTGFSVKRFSPDNFMGEYIEIASHELWRAFERCNELVAADPQTYFVIEDARQRQWYGANEALLYKKYMAGARMTPAEKNVYKGTLIGSGSIKRDCTAWEEFMKAKGYKYEMKRPTPGATKHSAEYVARATNWKGRTNEHGRDAAMLVVGLSKVWVSGRVK